MTEQIGLCDCQFRDILLTGTTGFFQQFSYFSLAVGTQRCVAFLSEQEDRELTAIPLSRQKLLIVHLMVHPMTARPTKSAEVQRDQSVLNFVLVAICFLSISCMKVK